MKRGIGGVSTRAARALPVVFALLGSGQRVNAADLDARPAPEQSLAIVGGLVALSWSADVELQTRWGPVVALGGGGRLGPSVNAYVADTVPLGPRWSLRPGFRFARSWLAASDCPTGCAFDFYVGEVGFRYRGPSGALLELGVPLFGWAPVAPKTGESHPSHLTFYTLATGELALLSTVLIGLTFDL
jgi:hypothetical protein